jgi:hypothetical protein
MPQLDSITFLTQLVCLFLFYFYLYLKFLKNVIGTTIAVLTARKYYLYLQYAATMVHLFENNTIKKQVGNYFGKYVKLLQLNAITKFFAVSHKIINVTNNDTHKS